MRRAVLALALLFAGTAPLAQESTENGTGETPRFANLANPLNLDDTVLSPLEQDFVVSHPVLRVGVPREPYPPFRYIEDEVVSGYAIEFLQSVATAIGFELELRLYDTWAEVLRALERREVDLTPTASITPDRERYLAFTVGIVPNPAGLIGRADDDTFVADQQLEGRRVAVGRGYAAESYLADQFPLAVPVPVPTTREALAQLRTGEVNYYYGDLADVFFEPDQRLVENLEIKQRVFFGSGWNHIAVRSDWPIVARLLDRFARSGREKVDPRFADALDARLQTAMTPLSLSPEEVAYLSDIEVIKVGSNVGVPLLNGIDTHGDHVGIASEFTAYLAYQIGRGVELYSYPTVEAMLAGLDAGEIDLIPYFAVTEKRERTLAFSRPYLTMPWIAFARTGDTLFWDLGSLDGHVLAMRDEHPLLPVLRERYPRIELLITDTAGASVKAVLDGRADAAVETKLYVNRELQRHAGRLRVLGEVRDDDGRFAFAVKRENAVMTRVIDKALATMSPDLVDRVVRRWVAIDFEPERRLRNLLRVLVPVLGVACLFLLATLYWNRRIARENRRRVSAERRLVDMTEGLMTGVFQFRHKQGEDVKMTFSNRVTREMARVPLDDDDGDRMTFFDHIDPRDRATVTERLRHSLTTGEAFRESFRFDFPSGEKGWILSDARCVRERDGTRLWNGYLFDLTAERLMSEELNAMLASRNEFVSMASHELRTPVQNIALALDSIERADVPPASLARLDTARTAADDLEELVNDIVQLSGMNHHAQALTSEPFDLHELVRTVCRTFSALAIDKSLRYDVHVDPALPGSVSGDALRLKQILYNIVGNAMKYTDAGSVTVRVEPDEGHGDITTVPIRITVVDTGIGIPEGALSSIFEPFATIGPASRRSSGLGLALCHRLAAVMGGRIEVSSVEGEGSTFTVCLTLARDTGEHRAGRGHAASGDRPVFDTVSESILVVDDDPTVSEILTALLEAEGWPTRQANSSAEALELLGKTSFRAVLTDQRMPGASGTELARRIRASFADGSPRPVLILMTGGLSGEEAAHSPELFDAMLFKPVKTDEIVRTIEDCLQSGADRDSADPSPTAMTAPAAG